jgi:predicted nucleic acid-binding protein
MLRADLLLIDEAEGREKALQRGVPIVGTLGVLDRAAAQGLLSLPGAIRRLKATNFRASAELYNLFLERDAQRSSGE